MKTRIGLSKEDRKLQAIQILQNKRFFSFQDQGEFAFSLWSVFVWRKTGRFAIINTIRNNVLTFGEKQGNVVSWSLEKNNSGRIGITSTDAFRYEVTEQPMSVPEFVNCHIITDNKWGAQQKQKFSR